MAPTPPRRRKGERRPAITPEQIEALTGYLRTGMYEEAACDAAGIAHRTYYRWKAEGEEAHRLCVAAEEDGARAPRLTTHQARMRDFYRELVTSTGGFQAAMLGIVIKGAAGGVTQIEVTRTFENVTDPEGQVQRVMTGETRKERVLAPDPKLALDVLARKFPQEWARTERVEVSGRDGGAIEQRVNVGDAAVNDPTVSAAVETLLHGLAGGGE